MTCQRTVEAGAYVLGALSPAQRIDFHQHLATCDDCRAEVADLAGLPGLLGRLDTAAAAELETAPVAPRSLLPATLERMRRNRRQRRWRTALVAAALVLLALAGVGTVAWRMDTPAQPTPPVAVELNPMQVVGAAGPVQAQIALVPDGSGTRLQMHCTYLSPGPYQEGKAWRLTLLVYAKGGDGSGTPVAVWTAEPGTDLSVTATTPLARDKIDRVELLRGDNTTLLWYPVT